MNNNNKETKIRREPQRWIMVCGVKFRTLYQLLCELREEGNKITSRKLGEYIKEGMPHGYWGGQFVFDDETKAKIPAWIANRVSLSAAEEINRRAAFYGRRV